MEKKESPFSGQRSGAGISNRSEDNSLSAQRQRPLCYLRQKSPKTCKDRLERLEAGIALLLQKHLARFSRTRAMLKYCCVAAACRRIIPEALAVRLIGSKLLKQA